MLCSIILLIAMIGAIVLTLSRFSNIRKQNISDQISKDLTLKLFQQKR